MCGFAPTVTKTNQSSHIDVTITSLSPSVHLFFLTKSFCASWSPSSARRFSQGKTDKKTKSKSKPLRWQLALQAQFLLSAHEFRLWLPRGLPFEGLREEDLETFLDIHCERSAIIAIVLSSTKHEFRTKTFTPSWAKSEPKQTNSHTEDSTMSHASDRNEVVMTVIAFIFFTFPTVSGRAPGHESTFLYTCICLTKIW